MSQKYYNEVMKVKFLRDTTIKEVTKDEIIFSDNSTLTDLHAQDCCENVYADWSYLQEEDIFTAFNEFKVFIVPNAGLRIEFYHEGYKQREAFIPCYNEQNGYYSSALSIAFTGNGNSYIESDVSDSCFDHIY